MKRKFFLFTVTFFILILSVAGQVGINTQNPLATLDVNGNLKVRMVSRDTTSINTGGTNVLVLGDDGEIQTNTADNLYIRGGGEGRGPVSAVKAQTAKNYVLGVSLFGVWKIIPFVGKVYDTHNDFNTTTYQYIVPATGVYDIFFQIQSGGLLSLGTLGIGLFKLNSNTTNGYDILASQTALVVSLVNTIKVNKRVVLLLNKGDVLYFAAQTPLLSVGLLSGEDVFFTIIQLI